MGHRDRRVSARDAALSQPLATRPESVAQAEREHDDGPQTARTACAGLARAELVRRNQRARARVILSCGKRKTMLLTQMLHHAPKAHWDAALGTRDIQALRGRSLLLPSHYPPSVGGYAPMYGQKANTFRDIFLR